MIEETGEVVSVDGEHVWVETMRQSACGSCSSGKVCGHKLLDQSLNNKKAVTEKQHYIKARISDASRNAFIEPGDKVRIGMPERHLLQAAFIVYLLPLVLFFTGLIASHLLGLAEPYQIFAAVAGLVAGLAMMRHAGRYLGRAVDLQPTVLGLYRDESPVRILTREHGLSAG